jgi:hypothetical protein
VPPRRNPGCGHAELDFDGHAASIAYLRALECAELVDGRDKPG